MRTLVYRVILAGLSFLSACASTHPGNVGRIIDDHDSQLMKVSAEKQGYYSDDHYLFITFTVENISEDMLRIKDADITFGSEGALADSVLVGQDLIAWADAEDDEKKKSEHNKKLAQAALIVGGALTGVIGKAVHSDPVTVIGGGAALGGAAWSLSSAKTLVSGMPKTQSRFPNRISMLHSPYRFQNFRANGR